MPTHLTIGCEPTYKELKHVVWKECYRVLKRCEPTYKELKLDVSEVVREEG